MLPPPQGHGGQPGRPNPTPPMGPPGHAPGLYGPPPTPQQYGTGPRHGAPYGAPPPQYPQQQYPQQQRYGTPASQSAPPSPFWEDLGRERRGLWGCGAVAIVLVLGLALFTAALVGQDESALGTTILLLVFALLCAFFLFRAVPRVTTAQGIGVDASGITFEQKAKWWFKGRTLTVPWHEIVAVKNRAGSISYYLRRTPPTELTPTWINHVAEGADNPESEDYSPLARLTFPSAGEQQNRLVEAVRAWRPDITAAPRPTFHTPVPGHHGHPQAGYQQATGHPRSGHPSAGQPQAPFEVRTKRRLEWFVGLIPALFMGLFMGAPIVILLQSATSPVDLVPLSVPGIILLASLVYTWFMVVTMPQYWAKQGVRVDAADRPHPSRPGCPPRLGGQGVGGNRIDTRRRRSARSVGVRGGRGRMRSRWPTDPPTLLHCAACIPPPVNIRPGSTCAACAADCGSPAWSPPSSCSPSRSSPS
ncbi:hypothetical protein GCM10028793_38480 [Nocardiopsis oceani]